MWAGVGGCGCGDGSVSPSVCLSVRPFLLVSLFASTVSVHPKCLLYLVHVSDPCCLSTCHGVQRLSHISHLHSSPQEVLHLLAEGCLYPLDSDCIQHSLPHIFTLLLVRYGIHVCVYTCTLYTLPHYPLLHGEL